MLVSRVVCNIRQWVVCTGRAHAYAAADDYISARTYAAMSFRLRSAPRAIVCQDLSYTKFHVKLLRPSPPAQTVAFNLLGNERAKVFAKMLSTL